MANLKIRLRFNPGRLGSPMGKLGEFASQTDKFLRRLAGDLGLDVRNTKWLAQNFTNDSAAFDIEYSEAVDDVVALRGRNALAALAGEHPLDACSEGLVSYATIAEFSKLGKALDADEIFYIGTYTDGHAQNVPNWRTISHKTLSQIRQTLEAPLIMNGSLQGILHSWHPGAEEPFFNIRHLADSALVKCEYGEVEYSRVHEATRNPNNVLHVYGAISWDRPTNAVIKVKVSGIDVAQPLSIAQFEKIFGSNPNMTGDLTTSDYMDWLRGENGGES